MPIKTTKFDPAEYIDSPEAEFELLADAIESGDSGYFAHALGIIARARGMREIAERSGITREALYRALSSEGDPKLKTLFSVTKALGYKLSLTHTAPAATGARKPLKPASSRKSARRQTERHA